MYVGFHGDLCEMAHSWARLRVLHPRRNDAKAVFADQEHWGWFLNADRLGSGHHFSATICQHELELSHCHKTDHLTSLWTAF